MQRVREIRPVREPSVELDKIESHIKAVFRFLLFDPILRELRLPRETLQNATFDPLLDAIEAGRVSFYRGVFSGRFSAGISSRLRELGATWDRRDRVFRLPLAQVPYDVRNAIMASESRFQKKLDKIDDALAKILPEQIAEQVSIADLLDTSLWRVDREMQKTLKSITILPSLTAEQRRKIADEWQDNMRLWIKDFSAEEIVKLRKNIQKNVLSGNRYESVVKAIKTSYGVTASKAKFLARQETSLLVTKLKEVRYTEAGIHEYRWACVAGSPAHPVRPSHKILDRKIFRWDDPPITTPPDQPQRRNNPGQDFNCRCSAIPIYRREK